MDAKRISSILHVLDPDSVQHAPRPDKLEEMYNKLENSFAQLQEENTRLRSELKECELQSKMLRVELQKVDTKSHRYYNAAIKAQNECDNLKEEVPALRHAGQREEILKVLVDEIVSPFLSNLDAFKDRVADVSGFLNDHVVFNDYCTFEDERHEALADVLPWLGTSLVELLETYTGKAATRSIVGGSQILIRVASCALLYRHLRHCIIPDHDKPISKASLLKTYVNMFKIASWALSSAETRSAFEAKLKSVFSFETRVRRLYPAVELSLHLPGFKADYNHSTMEAVGIDGRPLTPVPKGSQKIAAALGFGVRNGTRVALRAQVLLMSTLQDALDKEEKLLRRQPGGDGRD